MPTIRPILTLGKLYSISLAITAIKNIPYSSSGKTAIIILYFPILPSIYLLLLVDRRDSSSLYFSSRKTCPAIYSVVIAQIS